MFAIRQVYVPVFKIIPTAVGFYRETDEVIGYEYRRALVTPWGVYAWQAGRFAKLPDPARPPRRHYHGATLMW